MSRALAAGFLCLALFAPACLSAQQETAPVPEPGQTVRATLVPSSDPPIDPTELRVTGEFLRRDGDGLLIHRGADGIDVQVPIDRIDRLEIRTCCRRGGGALAGAGIGAVSVLVGGAVVQAMPSGGGANLAMAGAILLLPVGALLGAFVGSQVSPAETWTPAAIPDRP